MTDRHSTRRVDPPRELHPEEMSLLRALLEVDFRGKTELLAQLRHTRVSEECCGGCRTIGLTVSDSASPSSTNVRVPVEAQSSLEAPSGVAVLLHVVDGFLHELEIYSEDGAPLEVVPEPSSLTFVATGQA